jgi:hypothetical protein
MKSQATTILIGSLLAVFAVSRASAQVVPIAATGWNYDLVLNNPAPYNATVTGTMDGGLGITVEGWTWVEKGDYTNVDGNTQPYLGLVPGTHSSLTGRGSFTFQNFSGLNAIGLDGANSTATLTLTTPASYKSLAFYGASGYGSKTIDILLNFSDSTTTPLTVENGTGIGADWFNTSADRAMVVGARASNKSEEGYTRLFYQETPDIAMNESYFTLSAADQAKTLTSVTFETFAGDRTSIFALSGEPTSALASADFNSSGQVNADDLSLWKTGFGMSTGAVRINGDADADADVDGADFLLWQRQYTGAASAQAVTAVPEPCVLAMAIFPLAILACTRRLETDSRLGGG